MNGLGIILLGALEFLPSDEPLIFVYTSIVVRAISGYAGSLSQAAVISTTAQTFSDKKIEYISYLETGNGVGLIIGPPLGSVFYGYFGFSSTFYLFGALLWLNCI